jgi:hypothetical protein
VKGSGCSLLTNATNAHPKGGLRLHRPLDRLGIVIWPLFVLAASKWSTLTHEWEEP